MSIPESVKDIALALLRVISGLLFAAHGAQKIFGIFGGQKVHDPLLIVASVIELAGGLLVALGLFTQPVAFVASGEMAVAYFKAHAPGGFLPGVNHGELAVLYCFIFLYFAAHGAGRYGLDALRKHSRR
jgi:putative oxidoreductase